MTGGQTILSNRDLNREKDIRMELTRTEMIICPRPRSYPISICICLRSVCARVLMMNYMCTLQFISCALMLKVITYFYIKFELPSIFRNVSIQGREFSWEREDRDQISPRVFCGDGNDDFSSFVEMEMGSHSLTGNSQLPSLILKPNYSWTWLGGYFHSVRLGEKNGFWFHTYAVATTV